MSTLQFRNVFLESCRNLLKSHESVGIILSGGVDTAAVLQASYECCQRDPNLPKITCAITVYATPDAPDREYAQNLAKKFELRHFELNTTSLELVDTCLPSTVTILESFDPMNVRNSLIIDYALKFAQETLPDISIWLTGDGADELLGGYSFTWKTDEPIWSERRNDWAKNMSFATDQISIFRNLTVRSPFRDSDLISWVVENCNKDICIGDREISIKLTDKPQLHITGKCILRDAFPENPSAYRRKDPIEVGSGITEISKPGFFSSIVTKEREIEILKKAVRYGFRLREDLEQMKYFECFSELFLEKPDMRLKVPRKGESRAVGPFCVACSFQLYHAKADFCRTCGEWPANKEQ